MSAPPAFRPPEGAMVRDRSDVIDCLREEIPGARWMPVGGGTLLGRGGRPPDPVRRIDLSRLDRVLELAHEDLTVTVEAGARLVEVQAALAEKSLWLPLSVAPHPRSTMGGWIGADRRSPLAGAWSTVRDYVLGVTFATGAGETARAGGKVVKNVAGYDLMKPLVGSLGELGIVLEATFKVLPRPQTWAGVLLSAPDPQGRRIALEEIAVTLAPAGLWRFDLGGGEHLLAVFAGPRARVAFQVAGTRDRWGAEARALEGDRAWTLLGELEAMTRPDERATAWGGALPGFLATGDLGGLVFPSSWVVDLLGGHLWLADPTDDGLASAREFLKEGEGHLHRDAPANSFLDDPWGWKPGSERDLWQGMKTAFDPAGRLVRGRLPGGV